MGEDTAEPDLAELRDLLRAAFTPEELRRFCEDRDWLRAVCDDFGPGHGLNELVDRVVSFCRTRGLVDELLAAVREARPRRFAPFMGQPGEAGETTGRAARESQAPFQGPRALAEFVGREEELARLDGLLVPGGRAAITGLVGMGGLGKTELAKLAAARAANRFPDGVLWADCANRSPGEIADLWAAEYGVQLPGGDAAARLAAWRSLAGRRAALLVLDDVQAEQTVGPLLPPVGRSAVLITTVGYPRYPRYRPGHRAGAAHT